MVGPNLLRVAFVSWFESPHPSRGVQAKPAPLLVVPRSAPLPPLRRVTIKPR